MKAPTQPKQAQYSAFEDGNLRIVFTLSRDEPSVHAIRAFFSNKAPMVLSQINIQVAVQKYMKLQIFPASSTELQPLSQNGASQDMKITNSLEGQKPLVLKVKVTYVTQNGQRMEETKVLNDLPSNY